MYHIVNLVSPLLAENPRSHTRRERDARTGSSGERKRDNAPPVGHVGKDGAGRSSESAPIKRGTKSRAFGRVNSTLSLCVCVVETADAPRWVDRPFQSIARVCMRIRGCARFSRIDRRRATPHPRTAEIREDEVGTIVREAGRCGGVRERLWHDDFNSFQ